MEKGLLSVWIRLNNTQDSGIEQWYFMSPYAIKLKDLPMFCMRYVFYAALWPAYRMPSWFSIQQLCQWAAVKQLKRKQEQVAMVKKKNARNKLKTMGLCVVCFKVYVIKTTLPQNYMHLTLPITLYASKRMFKCVVGISTNAASTETE